MGHINQTCEFCREFVLSEQASHFAVTVGKKYGMTDRRVFETDRFVCAPTIGGFVPGYLLLIPKQHVLSHLTLPQGHLAQLDGICAVMEEFYREVYHSGFVYYEHGTASESNVGGMSIVHAHLHFIPCRDRVISSFSEYPFCQFESIGRAAAYYQAQEEKDPYLLLRDVNGAVYLAISPDIPSQYFRKRLCDIYGLPGYGNWREYPFDDNLKSTYQEAERFCLREKIKEVCVDG